jgi:hypothetical protein
MFVAGMDQIDNIQNIFRDKPCQDRG